MRWPLTTETRLPMRLIILLICVIASSSEPLLAAQVKVATASNFKLTMNRIIELYEQQSADRIVQINGSTGKHYAQIKNGAPYDLLFAANRFHPQSLEDSGLTIRGSGYNYALGKLVLWVPGETSANVNSVRDAEFEYVAIANPKLAPYGRAAQQVLQQLEQWTALQPQIVRGENVAQAFQFIVSGNAQMGFVAKSQLIGSEYQEQGAYWPIPQDYYAPIEQYAVLLSDNEAAQSFLQFCKSKQVQQLIVSSGYEIPPTSNRLHTKP